MADITDDDLTPAAATQAGGVSTADTSQPFGAYGLPQLYPAQPVPTQNVDPYMNSLAQAVGEPYQSPAEGRKPGEIRKNFDLDVTQSLGGIGAIGSHYWQELLNSGANKILNLAGYDNDTDPEKEEKEEKHALQETKTAAQLAASTGRYIAGDWMVPWFRSAVNLNAPRQAGVNPFLKPPSDTGRPFTQRAYPFGILGYAGEHFARSPLSAADLLGLKVIDAASATGGAIRNAANEAEIAARAKQFQGGAQVNQLPIGRGVSGVGPPIPGSANTLPKANLLRQIADTGGNLIPAWMIPHLPPSLQAIAPGGNVRQYIMDALVSSNNQRIKLILQKTRELGDALSQIPTQVNQSMLMAIAERTDPALVAKYGHDPFVLNAVNKIREFNDWFEKTFEIPHAISQRVKWGGEYLGRVNQERLENLAEATTDADRAKYSRPITMRDLRNPAISAKFEKWVQQQKENGGLAPGYATIVSATAIKEAAADLYSKSLGGLGTKTAQLAGNVAKGKQVSQVPEHELPGFLRGREEATVKPVKLPDDSILMSLRDPEIHAMGAGELTHYLIGEAAKFEAVRDLVKKLLNIPDYEKKGWEAFDVKTQYQDALKRAGHDPNVTSELFKDVPDSRTKIMMPPDLHKLLAELFQGPSPPSRREKILLAFSSFYTKGLFNPVANPDFPIRLGFLSAATNAFEVTGLKDAQSGLVANLIVAKYGDRINEILPPSMLGSHENGDVPLDLIRAGENLADSLQLQARKVGHVANKITYALPDKKARQATAISYLILNAKALGATREQLNFMTHTFNLTATIDKLAEGIAEPGMIEKVQKEVMGLKGNYSKMANTQRRGLRAFIPLVNVMAHLLQAFHTAIEKYPNKVFALRVSGIEANRLFQKLVPPRLARWGYVPFNKGPLNPHGGGYFRGWNPNILEMGAAIYASIPNLVWPVKGNHGVQALQAINPAIQMGVSFGAGRDINTGRRIESPAAVAGVAGHALLPRQTRILEDVQKASKGKMPWSDVGLRATGFGVAR